MEDAIELLPCKTNGTHGVESWLMLVRCDILCSHDPPPYSAMAMAQCMPPKKDAMLAPYATCKSAAFWRSSAGINGRLAATGGDNAMKGITPACTLCKLDVISTFNNRDRVLLRIIGNNTDHLLIPTAWREAAHLTRLLQQSNSVGRLLLLAMLVRQSQSESSVQLMLWPLAHCEICLVR